MRSEDQVLECFFDFLTLHDGQNAGMITMLKKLFYAGGYQ
jgi:hypothetical protein